MDAHSFMTFVGWICLTISWCFFVTVAWLGLKIVLDYLESKNINNNKNGDNENE